MRKIKFRAWDKEKKEMCAFVFPLMLSGSDIYESSQGNAPFHHYVRTDDFILMKYTGLHDKNGKEIYEGDIIRELNGKNWTVEFDTDYAGFYPLTYCSDGMGYGCGRVPPERCEVIGNIYENEDLIEKK